jgi:hypothetical protein
MMSDFTRGLRELGGRDWEAENARIDAEAAREERRYAERAAYWERVERAAIGIAARMEGRGNTPQPAWTVDAAILLIDEIDRRRAEEEVP